MYAPPTLSDTTPTCFHYLLVTYVTLNPTQKAKKPRCYGICYLGTIRDYHNFGLTSGDVYRDSALFVLRSHNTIAPVSNPINS